MSHRALALASLLVIVGCDAAHELPGELDSGAPIAIDAGEEQDAGIVDTGPCGGECADGVCDEASNACVECLSDEDCGGETPVCSENDCVTCAPDDDTCTDPSDPDPTDPDPTDPDPTDPDPTDPDPTDPDPTEPDPPAEPEPFNVRFGTYNVRTSALVNSAWGDFHAGWDDHDAARMRRVADTIAAERLTVVSAQEMRRPEREAVLARLHDHYGQSWGTTSQRQGRDDTDVLYRRSVWRNIRETHFLIPLQPGLEDRYEVGVLLEHRATGRRIWFYSAHFAAHPEGAAARVTAAHRTVSSLRDHPIHDGLPFVLGGDLNSTSGGPAGDIFRAAGFMRYARSAADRRVNNGCKSHNSLAGSEGRQQCPGGVAPHIDQVWVSRSGIRVRTHRVIATERTSRASDHNPLTVIMTVL